MVYPDAMSDEPQRSTRERDDDHNDSVIYKIGRGSKWVVPVTALSAAAVSVARLTITPPGWLRKAADAAEDVSPLDPDPIVCLTLSGVTLTYWLSRDGWDAILELFAMFKYATADRKVRERIARRALRRGRNEGRSEARSEAQAQIQAWWEEATKGGTQAPTLDNPPPRVDSDDGAAS